MDRWMDFGGVGGISIGGFEISQDRYADRRVCSQRAALPVETFVVYEDVDDVGVSRETAVFTVADVKQRGDGIVHSFHGPSHAGHTVAAALPLGKGETIAQNQRHTADPRSDYDGERRQLLYTEGAVHGHTSMIYVLHLHEGNCSETFQRGGEVGTRQQHCWCLVYCRYEQRYRRCHDVALIVVAHVGRNALRTGAISDASLQGKGSR